MARGENKIHIDVKEFSKDFIVSNALKDRLTNHFGVPFRREIRLKGTVQDRINLAASYKKMMEEGSFKTQSELARHLGVSRTWITKVLNTLKNRS